MLKILFREIFWFLLSIILALFFSFIFLEFLDLSSTERGLKPIEKVFSVQLYLIGCLVSFICIYIVRLIVGLIRMLTR
ncbi:MAG: hypothetical protein CBE49_002910 [Rickettsiales bacterium TMED289]|nr:MAG: hypothetical protein CBE49_002910 [Rickettsiales bacterium TMED289]